MKKRKENRRAGLIFIILPLLLVMVAVWLNNARGPYWLGANHDPDYVYLLNSVNTAELKKVGHYDHPGTTVQVIGAVTIRVVHFFSGSGESLKSDVLKRPEAYLNAINVVFVALNALMSYILGLTAFLITREVMLCIWLQMAPFFSTTIMTAGLTRVTPEPLLFFTAMLVTLLLVKYHRNGTADNKIIIYFGLAAGFGMATKVTFLPLLMMPVILFPGIRKKIVYGVSAVLSLVFFTLPIVSMYGKFYDWVYNILTHKGGYGTGAKGVISLQKYIGNITKLLMGNPMFTIMLIVTTAAVAAGLLVPKLRRKIKGNVTYKLLAAVLMAKVAGLLMVGKHPANHYLLPELVLTGIAGFGIAHFIKDFILQGENNYTKRFMAVVIFLAVAGISINPAGRLMDTVAHKNRIKENSLKLNRIMQNDYPKSARIYTYGSSSLQQAMKFGNDLSRNNHAEILDGTDKNVYFYDMLGKNFYRYDYTQKIQLSMISAEYGDKILFQGPQWTKIPGVRLKPVHGKGQSEAIFRVIPRYANLATQIVTLIEKQVPPGTALVVPEELCAGMTPLQQEYKLHPVNYKNNSPRRLIRLSEMLDNPYYLLPSTHYYGKGAVAPKKLKRLKAFAETLEPLHLSTQIEKKLTFGRLKSIPAGETNQQHLKEISVWSPNENKPENISPALHRFGERGKFELNYHTEGERKIATISNTELSKQGKTFYRMGYRANKKGLEMEIPRGKLVHLVVSVKVPPQLINRDNFLFIQDYDEKWNRRNRQFGGTGWMTYVVSKRVSPESTRLQFGLYFRPQKPGDSISIREVKIFTENER